ncbi:MAG: OmpA family protein [Pseudorhodobacter sp.]|nr:OmpA family protein [Pseudorhodobacter sp.]
MTRNFTLISVAILGLAVAGCTNPNGTPNQTGTGVVIGGLTGAAVGNAIGKDTKATAIGGLVGAAIGGAIGNDIARQQAELSNQLAGTGAGVVYNGTDLRVILPESITFATGSAVVNSSFRASLGNVADSLRRYPNSTVRVVGHTDNVGTDAYNQQLSEQRALAVASILIADGTASSRVTYSGRSFHEPVASNSSATGRAQNRRVEIIITPTN